MHGRWLTTAAVVTMVGIAPAATARAVPPGNGDASRQVSAADRAPLSPAQVAAQVKEADRLRGQLAKNDAALAKAAQQLANLSATSNALMSEVSAARADEAKAKSAEQRELAELRKLTAEVTEAKKDLDGMAYDAYVNGPGVLKEVASVMDLVTGGDAADAAASADYLAGARSADRQHFARLAARQQQVAKRAVAARTQREKATARAEKAQKAAAAGVAKQRAAVAALEKAVGDKRAKLSKLGVEDGMIAGVDLNALTTASKAPLCTEENASYPNGQWPDSALCGLKSASGHKLRPSAARAYDALSAAYLKANGTNLCITDSYRSLASQIDVKKRKPTLAAKPGTSNHGLGLAVDLCGGIESFGTPQHIWMQQHAPLFGFFHPSWAQAGGSKPEPWHWEYAG